ncbi:hypothetical protein [Streptomyces sp. NPDC056987]|uniref:hypothetical protein n=1 Tax=Streptomyces sp. NPDC056987 TaxID=3345988 RepID=UPI00363679C3
MTTANNSAVLPGYPPIEGDHLIVWRGPAGFGVAWSDIYRVVPDTRPNSSGELVLTLVMHDYPLTNPDVQEDPTGEFDGSNLWMPWVTRDAGPGVITLVRAGEIVHDGPRHGRLPEIWAGTAMAAAAARAALPDPVECGSGW